MPLACALITSLCLASAVDSGFQLDDHFQRHTLSGREAQDWPEADGSPPSPLQLFVFYDGSSERQERGLRTGELPWWTADGFRHANFRYLSVLTMMLDYALWPGAPGLMHLHSLAWLAALVWVVGLFYRRRFGAHWAAGLAVLLYALDESRVVPAVYLANRNALLATFFGVLAIDQYIREREAGAFSVARSSVFRILGPLYFSLSLLAGELGVATLAYVGAYALTLDSGTLRARASSLVPYLGVLLVWLGVRRIGDFGATGSGMYLDPLASPVAFLISLVRRATFLMLGQWTPIPADLGAIPLEFPWLESAVVLTLLFAIVLGPVLLRDAAARFWGLGSLLSLLPIAAAAPQNRLLLFVSVGAMGLLARFVELLYARSELGPKSVSWRVSAHVFVGGMALVHLVVAPLSTAYTFDYQERVADNMVAAIESVPEDPAIRDQDLILINPPDHVYLGIAIRAIKSLANAPVPRRLRSLVATSSLLRLTRSAPNVLEIELPDGLFTGSVSRYFRSADRPLPAGDSVELAGMRVDVLEGLDPANPTRLRFEFDVPLEDASLRWLRWEDGRYVPWTPIEVGASQELAAERGIFDG